MFHFCMNFYVVSLFCRSVVEGVELVEPEHTTTCGGPVLTTTPLKLA